MTSPESTDALRRLWIEFRAALGMSLREASEVVGVSATSIQAFEKGTAEPYARNLREYRRAIRLWAEESPTLKARFRDDLELAGLAAHGEYLFGPPDAADDRPIALATVGVLAYDGYDIPRGEFLALLARAKRIDDALFDELESQANWVRELHRQLADAYNEIDLIRRKVRAVAAESQNAAESPAVYNGGDESTRRKPKGYPAPKIEKRKKGPIDY